MAGFASVSIRFLADLQQFSSQMQNATRQINGLGKNLRSVGRSLSFTLTAPLTGFAAAAVNSAVNVEKLQTSLDVLTGSAEAGADAFQRLEEYSASTPFQLNDLVSVNNQLLGFGLNVDSAFESLQMLGDVASVSGADLNRVAVAFGQSAAAGRVMTQDLNQFINNGIPIYQLLGDVTGKNVGELRDLASEGKITFDLLNRAFKTATSEGGKFFNGTAKLSQTLGGRLSTLKDNFNLLLADIGQIIGDALGPVVSYLTDLFQRIKLLSPETKKLVVILSGIAAALGPVIIVLGILITNLQTVIGLVKTLTIAIAANPIGAFAVAISAVAAALLIADSRLTSLTNATKEFGDLTLQASKNIAKERAELNKYLTVARDDTKSKEQREAAIKKLNNLSPEYLNNLSLETINTKSAKDATDDYVASLLQKSKVIAAEEKLVEVQKKLLDLQLNTNKAAAPSVWQNLGNAVLSAGNSVSFTSLSLRSLGKNIAKEYSELSKLEKTLIDFLSENGGIPVDTKKITDPVVKEINKDVTDGLSDLDQIELNNLFEDFEDVDRLTRFAVAAEKAGFETFQGFVDNLYNEDQQQQVSDKLTAFKERLQDFNTTASEIIQGAAQNFAAGFGNIIGAIASGAAPLSSISSLILNSIGNLLQQLGRAAINIGITMQKIQASFSNPLAAIAAGIAAIALGSIIKSVIPQDLQRFQDGGIVGGSSFYGDKILARVNSGELILNQSQQRSLYGQLNTQAALGPVVLETRISGEDLVLVQSRANKTRNRTT